MLRKSRERRFVAKVVGSVPATLADKPAKYLLFDDGATVPFYVHPHPKATKTKKHVYLGNPEVKFEMPCETPAPTPL